MRPGAVGREEIDVREPRQTALLVTVRWSSMERATSSKHHRYEIAGEVLSIETYRLSFRSRVL
jgi:hypothetical protein